MASSQSRPVLAAKAIPLACGVKQPPPSKARPAHPRPAGDEPRNIRVAAIVKAWRALEADGEFASLKASFVPDHVYLAVRLHPAVVPAEIVLALMNESQRVAWRDSRPTRARVERLWQHSAYIARFGELATPQIDAYLRRLHDEQSNAAAKRPGGSRRPT